jgi:hypothetical protein
MHLNCSVRTLFLCAFVWLSSPLLAQCLTRPSLDSLPAGVGSVNGVSAHGFMFDVQNTSGTEVRVTGLDQVVDLGGGSYDFEIYTRPGTWEGFESSPSGWTLVGQALGVPVTLTGSIVPIPVALNIVIAPYGIQAFYVTTRGNPTYRLRGWSGANGIKGFTTGTDGILNVVCGVGKFYAFSYTLNQRVRGGGGFSSPGRHYCWQGRVRYCQVPGFAASNTVLGAGCGGSSPPVLTATSLPRLNSNWSHTLTNVPPTAVLGVTILGFSDPGLNDLSSLGMPGCGLRASLDAVTVFPVSGPTHIQSVLLPNTAALVGTSLYASAALFQNPPVNPFGAITANGLQGAIGYQ